MRTRGTTWWKSAAAWRPSACAPTVNAAFQVQVGQVSGLAIVALAG